MSIPTFDKAKRKFNFSSKLRFVAMITAAILISIVSVCVSMYLYRISGAAQLDLSRPGYQDVRAQSITQNNNMQTYSSSGAINQSTLDEFKVLFEEQVRYVKAIDAFGGDPLNPEALDFNSVD